MAFDPDAYLAAKTGGQFNPDDYLASKGADQEPEQTFLKPGYHRHPFKGGNTGPIDQVRRELDPNQIHVPTPLEGAAGALNSVMDRYSLGSFGGLLRVGKALGLPTGPALDSMERYRAETPIGSAISDAPAYLTEGPLSKLTEGVGGLVDRGVEAGFSKAAPIIKRIGKSALTAMGVGSGVSASQAASEGASPDEIAHAARMGGEGSLAVATPLAGAAALAGGAGRAIQGSKGGKARQFLEQRGVHVGPFDKGSGGPMNSMVTQGTSDADIGQQAAASAERGIEILNQEKKGALRAVGRSMERAATTPEAAQLHDVSHIVTKMQDAIDDISTDDFAAAKLQKAIKDVTKKQGAGFNPETDPYLISETDVNKLRRKLSRYGSVGTSTDEGLHPLADAAAATREITDQGPFAKPNAEYTTESRRYQKSRRLLGIAEKPKTPEESRGAVEKVKNLITRAGQNTVTAGGQQRQLRQFAERHPDIAAEFERPEILRKRAGLTFDVFPEHGGLIERTAGIAKNLRTKGLPAIQARLLYGPSLAAQAAEPLLLGEIPLLTAARNTREAR